MRTLNLTLKVNLRGFYISAAVPGVKMY